MAFMFTLEQQRSPADPPTLKSAVSDCAQANVTRSGALASELPK
jgi:hypothetical protein